MNPEYVNDINLSAVYHWWVHVFVVLKTRCSGSYGKGLYCISWR